MIISRVFDEKIIEIGVSGSSQQVINGTNQLTKPEYAIYPFDKKYDWCSKCEKTYDTKPWIGISLRNKKLRINGYFLRAGCCYESRCCCDNEYYGYCVECCMYSWSLLISDDNQTWTEIHRVDKDNTMKQCKEATYKFNKEFTTRFVKIVQNEACPGWPPCMAINKIEFLGNILGEDNQVEDDDPIQDDIEDDVSIIGHISHNRL